MVENYELKIIVPFPNPREAEIAYVVLEVDCEPPRSKVVKKISLDGCLFLANFQSPTLKQLRVAVDSLFDKIALVAESLQRFGPPTSTSYDFIAYKDE